ncbi:TPA: DUF6660 family protein [Elizabethkingia meningoseptica]
MKYLGLILAVFFTFLLIVPCNDSIARPDNNKTTIQKHTQNESNHHDDLCSPLCSCACCGVHVTAANFAIAGFKTNLPDYYDKIVSAPVMSAFDITYGVWQPPKI